MVKSPMTEVGPETVSSPVFFSPIRRAGSASGRRGKAGALDKLRVKHMQYTRKVQRERIQINEIETRIATTRSEIARCNATLQASVKQSGRGLQEMRQKKTNSALSTKVHRMERMQHNLQLQLNSLNSENEGLKQQVNNLRIEQVNSTKATDKLCRKFEKAKKLIQRRTKEAQVLREKKEVFKRHYERLKIKTVEEVQRAQESREQCLAPTAALQTTLRTTMSPPPVPNSAKKRRERFLVTDRERPATSEGDTLQHEVNKAYWVVAKTRMDMHRRADRKRHLYEAFERIKSETNVGNLTDLLNVITGEEELNFEMFGAISELNQELEELQLEKGRNEQQQAELEKAMRNQSRSIASADANVTQQIQKTQKSKLAHEKEYTKLQKDIMRTEDTLKGIIITLTSQEEDPFAEALIKNGLSMNNLSKFLAFIEEKINRLNQVVPAEAESSVIEASKATGGASLAKPVPPAILEADASSDEDEKEDCVVAPLDITNFKEKIAFQDPVSSTGAADTLNMTTETPPVHNHTCDMSITTSLKSPSVNSSYVESTA